MTTIINIQIYPTWFNSINLRICIHTGFYRYGFIYYQPTTVLAATFLTAGGWFIILLDIWFVSRNLKKNPIPVITPKKKHTKCLHRETQVSFQSRLPLWPFHSLLIRHLRHPFHRNHLLECLANILQDMCIEHFCNFQFADVI